VVVTYGHEDCNAVHGQEEGADIAGAGCSWIA